jgi:RNA polymerase sigma-70 factor (ECF subfamily)
MDANRLYDEHHESLHRYLVRLTGDADLADDATQETFARLLARPPRDENPRAWLFTVATNLVRGWSNKRRRRNRLLEGGAARVPSADPPQDPASAAEAEAQRSMVRRALAALTDRERTILLMREEGFAHREIASIVGTTTGSIGTMIARALERLAQHLPLDVEDVRS